MNHGHRSAVKRILDGDASPASMMVLCVSDIRPLSNNSTCEGQQTRKHEDADKPKSCKRPINCDAVKIELTDGWYGYAFVLIYVNLSSLEGIIYFQVYRYSLDAILDGALSNHLVSGKLFVGQKLRVR